MKPIFGVHKGDGPPTLPAQEEGWHGFWGVQRPTMLLLRLHPLPTCSRALLWVPEAPRGRHGMELP